MRPRAPIAGWLATMLMGAIVFIPPVLGQPTVPPTAAQSSNLAEAERLGQQAVQLYQQGKYPEAIPLAQRALAIFEQSLGANHPSVGNSLNNLAELYQDQGNYRDAELLHQRALAIFEKSLGANHPLVATSLDHLAGLYQNQGNYRDAEPLLKRALAIREKALGSNHPHMATNLNNLANLYLYQGNYREAEPLLRQALTIFEKALGANHPDVAISLSNLAALYSYQGNYREAEPLHQRALTIFEKALGANHPSVANSLNNLAVLYKDQGNYQDAELLVKRALVIREQTLGANHPDVANSLDNLAVLYLAKGEMTRAIDFWSRGLTVEEHNLELILATGSERQKQDYMATLSGTINGVLSLHLQSAAKDPQAARLALTTVLRRKGRVLDALADSLQRLRQQLTPADQQRLDQLSALVYKGPGNTPVEQYRAQIAALETQSNQLEADLNNRSAEFRTESQPVTIAAVQRLIPTDAALVELVLYYPFNPKAKSTQRWGKPHYAAYVLHTQGDPQWVDLGEAEPIHQSIRAFQAVLLDPTQGASRVKPVARKLDAVLMQPVRKLLGNRTKLLLSPDSQLNLIPFAALVDEQNRYLVETYEITYLTSGRDLLRLQTSVPSRQPPVLIANPDYDRATPAQSSVSSVSPSSSRSAERSIDLSKLKFGSLPGTAQEANAIAPKLPGVIQLMGAQATENALKQVQAPRILHIATHGFFLADTPLAPPASGTAIASANPAPRPLLDTTENALLRSGLALAGFNTRQSGNEDGVLTALEAASLNLRGTQLVVLSACETGLGGIANGEGVYGLRRAIVMAGSESQVFTLWQVDDEATSELMAEYYDRLSANQGRSAALRQIQLEFLNHPNYKHPYYWSAFIPSGNWHPLKMP